MYGYSVVCTYEQVVNAQRLERIFNVKFLRRKEFMLLRSRERKELIQIQTANPYGSRPLERRLPLRRSLLVVPLSRYSALTQIFTNSGESLTSYILYEHG